MAIPLIYVRFTIKLSTKLSTNCLYCQIEAAPGTCQDLTAMGLEFSNLSDLNYLRAFYI